MTPIHHKEFQLEGLKVFLELQFSCDVKDVLPQSVQGSKQVHLLPECSVPFIHVHIHRVSKQQCF